MPGIESHDIVAEFEDSALPDARLQQRLERIAEAMEAKPDSSFPEMFASEAELEAFYRFVRNDRVTWDSVLAPHVDNTVQRAEHYDTVVVAHDTTEFRFGGDRTRDGLARGGRGRSGPRSKQGFLCHVSLAVSATPHRAPLGVLAMQPWARTTKKTPTALRLAGASREEIQSLPSEQDRWMQAVETVTERLGTARPIHVMDSEADDYSLLADLSQAKSRFVIRMCYDRILLDPEQQKAKTRAFVATAQPVCTYSVQVSARKPSGGRVKRRSGARQEREATLEVRARPGLCQRPSKRDDALPKTLPVNIVAVTEVDPPEDAEPIEWLLVTSEPIETQQDILAVIDYYRARWRVEEFFKAVKTGCAYQKRQLESLDTLLVALAMFVPVAWQLLQLRTLTRTEPSLPAGRCLTHRQLLVLRRASKSLPDEPTVRDALLYIARLGGHLKRNGEPGWETLGRGYLELLALERGFALAAGCDQS